MNNSTEGLSRELSEMTDADIDFILERFDLTEPTLQRRTIARLILDRMVLLEAGKEAFGALVGSSASDDSVQGRARTAMRSALVNVGWIRE